MPDLEIRNLHVRAGEKDILRGVDLSVGGGEIHALMGPNGSGKSTLANVIMGHPSLEVTEGEIIWGGENINEADTDERARMGLFMAFQHPVSVPGVTVTKYLRTVLNAHRTAKGEEPISLKDFRQTVQAAMELTNVPEEFTRRYLNDGFSGGEKKNKLEILQLAVQTPSLAILDETDSGLDIDALRTVAEGVNTVAGQQGSDLGVLIITHYQRILHLVQPSHVHVLYRGRIVKQGGPELVEQLEAHGYGWITDGGRSRCLMATQATHIRDLTAEFPVLRRKIGGRPITYLDSAATSQTPQVVIDAIVDYYSNHRASVHRGVYPLIVEATDLYEGARERIAAWLGSTPAGDDLHSQRDSVAEPRHPLMGPHQPQPRRHRAGDRDGAPLRRRGPGS